MSKKYYQAIAKVLLENDPADSRVTDPADTWRSIVEGLADLLAADNKLFNRDRFIEACQTGVTREIRL